MNAFPAQYPGLCLPCGQDIRPGESIVNDREVGYIHEDCVDDVGKVGVESNGAGFDSFTRGRPPITVLPRGKTGKDRCDKCFIVHASGQVECE